MRACSVLIGVETYPTERLLATSVEITREREPDSSSGLYFSTSRCSGLAFGMCWANNMPNVKACGKYCHAGFSSEGMPSGGMADSSGRASRRQLRGARVPSAAAPPQRR